MADAAQRRMPRRTSNRRDDRTGDAPRFHKLLDDLRESERRFRLFVHGVIDYAIFMMDPEGIITEWNAGAERIKGYRASEIIGKHFSQFYTAEDRENGVPTRAIAVAAKEGRFETEGWRVRKDGTLPAT